MSEPSNQDLEQHIPWVRAAIIAMGIALLLIFNLVLLFDTTERRLYGDMFGAVNALFLGLAFAGIIYSIILQNIELKLQRKELRESRLAQQKTGEELQQQTLLSYVTLKYGVLNKLIEELPKRIEQREGAINKETAEKCVKDEQFLKRIDKYNSVVDKEKLSAAIVRAREEDLYLRNLKEKLKELLNQREELDVYMSLENPPGLKIKIAAQER